MGIVVRRVVHLAGRRGDAVPVVRGATAVGRGEWGGWRWGVVTRALWSEGGVPPHLVCGAGKVWRGGIGGLPRGPVPRLVELRST